jgi:hypothetical protein
MRSVAAMLSNIRCLLSGGKFSKGASHKNQLPRVFNAFTSPRFAFSAQAIQMVFFLLREADVKVYRNKYHNINLNVLVHEKKLH